MRTTSALVAAGLAVGFAAPAYTDPDSVPYGSFQNWAEAWQADVCDFPITGIALYDRCENEDRDGIVCEC
jgi:hypothetical protein